MTNSLIINTELINKMNKTDITWYTRAVTEKKKKTEALWISSCYHFCWTSLLLLLLLSALFINNFLMKFAVWQHCLEHLLRALKQMQEVPVCVTCLQSDGRNTSRYKSVCSHCSELQSLVWLSLKSCFSL